eukprot:gene31299-38670_t
MALKTCKYLSVLGIPQYLQLAFINQLYGIPSNVGNAAQSQSVFETADEYYSPTDLARWQSHYNMPLQAAVDIGGYSTDTCAVSGSGNDCFEGNLDIQYIAGVAQ